MERFFGVGLLLKSLLMLIGFLRSDVDPSATASVMALLSARASVSIITSSPLASVPEMIAPAAEATGELLGGVFEAIAEIVGSIFS